MHRRIWPAALVLAMMVLPALPAAATVATAATFAPDHAFLHSGPAHPTGSSTNWAGYAVTGPSGSVSWVNGSWIQPTATCPARGVQYAAFWVGIDGFSSSTVEQTGTDSDCSHGTALYYAWYEFYPAFPVTITAVTIHPGDVISAEVHYVNSSVGFRILLDDVTTGLSYSHAAKVASAVRTSAEWIGEAPSSSKVLPLANFGTVKFGTDATAVLGTDTATISGTTGAIGSFSSSSVNRINMVTSSGTITKAATSVLTPDGTSFNITWKHH